MLVSRSILLKPMLSSVRNSTLMKLNAMQMPSASKLSCKDRLKKRDIGNFRLNKLDYFKPNNLLLREPKKRRKLRKEKLRGRSRLNKLLRSRLNAKKSRERLKLLDKRL